MPTDGNPRRAFRLDDPTWEDFRIADEAGGWDRGTLLKDFVLWYTYEPDRITYRRVPHGSIERSAPVRPVTERDVAD